MKIQQIFEIVDSVLIGNSHYHADYLKRDFEKAAKTIKSCITELAVKELKIEI